MENQLRRLSAKSIATHIWPAAFFLAASLVFTWPLITRLRGWVPGLGDWGQNMWALWWTRKALLVLRESPFFTKHLFYPDGVTLLFHPLDMTDGLIALPFYGIVGGDISYNLIVLISFVLSGLGSYYLVLYLTRNRWAAMVAGLVFSLSPYHFLRLELGHLNLASMQWIPFYLLFFFKYLREGRIRSAWMAVLFMVLNAGCSWYYVVACGLLSLAAVGWCFVYPIRLPGLIMRIALVLAISVAVLSPLLVPMLQSLHNTELVGEHNPLRHSVDLNSFWVLGPPSTWASGFESIWAPYAAQHREPGTSGYLGYSVLLLCIAGLVLTTQRKEALWWLAVGVGFIVLSLGPKLQVGGEAFDTALPYNLLHAHMPGFSAAGIPGRFVVMTSLVTAVLAGYGLAALGQRIPGTWPMAPLVAALAISLEFLTVPVNGSRTALPQFYRSMAEDGQQYAILDVKWDANYLMHAQTVHGKPLVGGWLARLPGDKARYLNQGSVEKAVVYLLLGEQASDITDPDELRAGLNESLGRHQVRYIIDHDRVLGDWIEQALGWRASHEEKVGDHITVYEPPAE